MNGDLSPQTLIKRMLDSGYRVVQEKTPSPVGRVPKGSTVLTDYNGKRAVWILGKIYQHPNVKG